MGKPGTYSTDFEKNIRGAVEHFDVYGEVQTQYSQVYWTRNSPIPLPKVRALCACVSVWLCGFLCVYVFVCLCVCASVFVCEHTCVLLPQALVERFAGKVMAITGYEVDQVGAKSTHHIS